MRTFCACARCAEPEVTWCAAKPPALGTALDVLRLRTTRDPAPESEVMCVKFRERPSKRRRQAPLRTFCACARPPPRNRKHVHWVRELKARWTRLTKDGRKERRRREIGGDEGGVGKKRLTLKN